jgi:hypothetical protein
MFPVPTVNKSFDESGRLLQPALEKRSENFIKELLWCITARQKM